MLSSWFICILMSIWLVWIYSCLQVWFIDIYNLYGRVSVTFCFQGPKLVLLQGRNRSSVTRIEPWKTAFGNSLGSSQYDQNTSNGFRITAIFKVWTLNGKLDFITASIFINSICQFLRVDFGNRNEYKNLNKIYHSIQEFRLLTILNSANEK